MLIENVSWYSKMSNMILVCLTHKMAPGQGYRHLILGKGSYAYDSKARLANVINTLMLVAEFNT